ncbi:MAG: GxxExxY protein [Sphingobacteriaceae bacterium]|nr:GxxExxY protein [Sphingobacteriaceae bacterium]
MNTENNSESLLHKNITEEIISAYYFVYNELGYGFLEKVYENAMLLELKSRGFKVESQKIIKVYFKDTIVGEYFADTVVNDKIILELKSCESLASEHEVQLFNYLKATEIEVGLLFNFGKRAAFKRKVFTNNNKKFTFTN